MPVLVAEAILWMGFGALLPVLPLYITEQGIDTATLGWIVAAWPAARLLGEPLFGWLADRGDKRVLMLGGLIGTAVAVPLPLVFTGASAFIVARALAGFTTAAYDPAARGYIVQVRPELVVEIAFNELQVSRRYAGGLALRFARVIRYRPDKRPEDADTIETVRAIAAGRRGGTA